MCVGHDCEFTDAPKKAEQRYLPAEKQQCAVILQVSVAYETLAFQIYQPDAAPEALRQFLGDRDILFRGAAIHNDAHMLKYYVLDIVSACDL